MLTAPARNGQEPHALLESFRFLCKGFCFRTQLSELSVEDKRLPLFQGVLLGLLVPPPPPPLPCHVPLVPSFHKVFFFPELKQLGAWPMGGEEQEGFTVRRAMSSQGWAAGNRLIKFYGKHICHIPTRDAPCNFYSSVRPRGWPGLQCTFPALLPLKG